MYDKLPAPQDKVRRRLIEKWILSQPSTDDQIDGLAAILGAFKDVIEPMLGSVGTRAVFSRTAMLARQRFPELGYLPADALQQLAALGYLARSYASSAFVLAEDREKRGQLEEFFDYLEATHDVARQIRARLRPRTEAE